MENKQLILWQGPDLPALPKKVTHISQLVDCGLQLSLKDRIQITKTFEDEHYEMVSTYIWTKAINALKNQLSKMGVHFIAEMLDRPDITEHSNIQQAITEFEAIRLAEDLGVITGTAAFRLRQAMETVMHFNQPDLEEDPDNEISREEAQTIIRACILGSLGYNKIEAAIDFKNFREDLENKTLPENSPYIIKLEQSPYFFHRATIRILLALIKSTSGAQLENSLANANVIVPKIWSSIRYPERYQVGRSYAELFTDGQTKAASGLRQVLLKVKGFDFVPEDLRSTSFIKAASEVLSAHEGYNNFYNEPAPVSTLHRMGSVIPMPAFPICMTAILSVRLGNYYGAAHGSQSSASAIITSISRERWIYFFHHCLPSDERLLYKLTQDRPVRNWIDLFSEEFIDDILSEMKARSIINLLRNTKERKTDKISSIARDMINKIGYTTK